jgi:prephenate dehydrogenase
MLKHKRIAVAGLGLIGGSIEKSALRAGYEVIKLHRGSIKGLDSADVVFVAMPPEAIVEWIKENKNHFKDGSTIVDVCGVKRYITNAISKISSSCKWHFIGAHPMAGKERSGYENSTADLFDGASIILTPFPDTPRIHVDELSGILKNLGFRMVVEATPERHDEMIAFTSQLCHIIASSYSSDELVSSSVGFSAGSYADMTRIATMDPECWTSLFSENKDKLTEVLDRFIGRMIAFRDSIAAYDRAAVYSMIEKGAKAKELELEKRKQGVENV